MSQHADLGFGIAGALGAIGCLLSFAFGDEGKTKQPAAVTAVILRDVHPLYGGQNLYLRGDGTGACQVVSRHPGSAALSEQRFKVALSPEAMREIARLIEERHFASIAPKRKAGIPGEARPTIAVTPASGKSLAVSKWANEDLPDFDAIYKVLQDKARLARRGKPSHEGDYESLWAPEGFTLP